MSWIQKLQAIKARAEQGEAVLDKMFTDVDNGVTALEAHGSKVGAAFGSIASMLEDLVQSGEQFMTGSATAAPMSPTLTGLAGNLPDIDTSGIASALSAATGLSQDIVGAAVTAHVASLPAGTDAATDDATKAVTDKGVGSDLAAKIAQAVAKTVSVMKSIGASAEHVAPAVVAHANATDDGQDAHAAATSAAQLAGAGDGSTAIADAVSAAS